MSGSIAYLHSPLILYGVVFSEAKGQSIGAPPRGLPRYREVRAPQ
jgi:hypothetical protein